MTELEQTYNELKEMATNLTKNSKDAINIAKLNGFKKIAVISGDGVRNYYMNKM